MATAVLLSLTHVATAEERTSVESAERPSARFALDRDAFLFVWLPLAGTAAVDVFVTPRETPWMFGTTEGGEASRRSQEVPGVALSIGGALVAGSFLLGDDPARYQHAKGLAESLATSGFIAVSAKRVFGRQRPDFDTATGTSDGRRSFPSGHATRAVSTITYAALYLRLHGFDQWREPGTLPWWEVASYVGLGSLAVGLSAERVYNNRHHASDVVAGGLLGAASSTLFFVYNERKYRRSKRPRPPSSEVEPIVVDASAERPTMPALDAPMLTFGGRF